MRNRMLKILLFAALILPGFILQAGPDDPDKGFTTETEESSLSCKASITLTLNELGWAKIYPQMLLSQVYPSYDDFVVEIINPANPAMEPDTADCSMIGSPIQVMVTDTSTGYSCWSDVLVEDKLPPTIECDPLIVPCHVDPFNLPDSIRPSRLYDNCTDSIDMDLSYVPQHFPNYCNTDPNFTYKMTLTWTATDESGRSSSCQQMIFWEKPSLDDVVCPDDTVVQCGDDISPEALGMPMLHGKPIDNNNQCMIVVGEPEDEIIPLSCPMKIIRTWEIWDWCLMEHIECIQSIEIEDSEAPEIYCPPDVTVSADMNCEGTYLIPDPTVSDNCTEVNDIELTYMVDGALVPGPLLTGLELGVHTIKITATDMCHNSSECEFTVTVEDDTPPVVINCDDASVCLEPDGTVTVDYSYFHGIIFEDNCDDVFQDTMVRRVNFHCGDPADLDFGDSVTFCCEDVDRVVMVEIKIRDMSGNENFCMLAVEVMDCNGVTIECPDDDIISCTELDDYMIPPATVNSVCPIDVDSTTDMDLDDCGTGTMTTTWTATSSTGNIIQCMQVVEVEGVPLDSLDFDWPEPVVEFFACEDFEDLAFPLPAMTGMIELCGAYSVDTTVTQITPATLGCFTWQIDYTVTDSCNFDPTSGDGQWTLEQTVGIHDTVPPEIVCPADVILDCPADTSPANTGFAAASDSCTGTATTSYFDNVIQGSCPNDYTVERSWVAEDGCGNRDTCIQVITVQDTTPPEVVFAPADTTVECDADLTAIQAEQPEFDDACGDLILTAISAISPDPDCGYRIDRSWTAADSCGNEVTVSQTIIVNDETAPDITCPPDVTVDCTESTDTTSTGRATAMDNCDLNPQVTFSDTTLSGSCIGEMTIERTWTATDSCGNDTSCVQIITVEDNTAPLLTCPPDTTLDCPADTTPASTGMATATDNCTPQNVAITYSDDVTPGTCEGEMTIERTWTATDDCGNDTSCVQIITVVDETAPEITCPPDITLDCPADTTPANTGMATATDDCSSTAISYADTVSPGSCIGEMTIERTWTATDDCGNEASCVQVIFVQDTTPPTIVCPPNVSIGCSAEPDTVFTGSATAVDSCDPDPVIVFEDDEVNDSTIERTWVATDDCGNADSCVQVITITDTVPPEFECIKMVLTIPDSLMICITARMSVLLDTNVCHNRSDFFFSFDSLDLSDTIRCFDCDDATQIFFDSIWVFSKPDTGFVFSCEAEYGISDADSLCGSMAQIDVAGQIRTPMNDPVPKVDVTLKMNGDQETSNDQGEFMFEQITSSVIHRLDAYKDDHYLNGVTAYDLSLIQRHIASIEEFHNAYQYFAADANGDELIDVIDVLALRKLLLGIDTDLSVPSWQFFDSHFDMGTSTNPFYLDVPDHVMVYHNRHDMYDADFVGVKTGDVDFDADLSLLGGESRDRSIGYLTLGAPSQAEDDHWLIPLYADRDIAMNGGQFEIRLDGGSIEEVKANEAMQAEANEINHDLLQRNKVRMVWIAENPVVNYSQPILWVRVKAENPGQIEWKVSDTYYQEVFDLYGHKYDVDLKVESENTPPMTAESSFALYQNLPNPFNDATIVRFTLADKVDYEMRFYDTRGALLYSIDGKGIAGLNQVEVSKEALKGFTGMVYYSLQTEENFAVKKMIVH